LGLLIFHLMNQDKKALLSDLILLAKADNKITISEYDFIKRMAKRMDVSAEEVDILFKNTLPSKPIISEVDRITHFHKLTLLMNIDGKTHEKEEIMLRNFGLKMGIRPEAINQILLRMHQYEGNIIPSDEIIKIFKTFYN